MTDTAVEGQWVWTSDGTPVTWTDWYPKRISRPGEPDGGREENCALLVMARTGTFWMSYPWNRPKSPKVVVCEKIGKYTIYHLTKQTHE